MKVFEGRVHSVVYEDPAQAFYILKMVLDECGLEPVSVRGYVPGLSISIGTWFAFEGDWKKHPKYGNQIVISKAPVLRAGWDPDTAAKMLVSNGVGEWVVLQIRAHFGDQDFVSALGDIDRLKQVPGLGEFSATHVLQRWESTQTYFQTLNFLGEMGLPPGKIRQVWQKFGDEAEHVLSKNPWALVQVDGIRFDQADEIARKLNLDLASPERVHGAALYVAKDQGNFGHLYLTTGQFFASVSEYIPGVTTEAVGRSLVHLHKEKLLVIDRTTRPGTVAVYEPWSYTMEDQSAVLLCARAKSAAFGSSVDPTEYIHALSAFGPKTEKASKAKKDRLVKTVRTAVEEWGDQAHINLSSAQREGVVNALLHPVSLLTGLPGTGKTTSLKAVVRILQDAEVPFLLCAPTGIAAKRLQALTGANAYTIHRAFAAKGKGLGGREANYTGVVGDAETRSASPGEGEFWGYSPENPHPARVVIIDEASMVDQHLLYRLLSCTAPNCRMVFVGDYAQLPSVGPGNVLRDLISCGLFPLVKLTEIFRQEDTSGIVYAAHAVHRGEMPETSTTGDFVLLPVDSDQQVLATILKLAQALYAKRTNFQILSPRHAGTVGVTSLNENLRELLNPKQPGLEEVRLGDDTIREDDRVMVVKNDYQLGIFNGDVGKVSQVNLKTKEIQVKIFGAQETKVQLKFQDAPKLIRLAYACTVHKAQGLEYDVIVMPVVKSFRHQLQRNLYYTAITRARKRVVLVGSHEALASAVANAKEDERNSLFIDRLRGGLGSPP